MKFFIFIFFLFTIISCGNNHSKVSSSDEGICQINNRSIPCDSIQTSDGLGTDLLESMIVVPIKIQDNDIFFLTDKSALSYGRKINCETKVREGEIYRFALRTEGLILMTENGTFNFERLSGEDGLFGAWMWKGIIDDGSHMIRVISFLDSDRVIIRTICEF